MAHRLPKFCLEHIFAGLNKTPGAITKVEMTEYYRAFSPASIHDTVVVLRQVRTEAPCPPPHGARVACTLRSSTSGGERLDERMSFSAWHALAAHRPLGGIMRVRQDVYAAAARFRVDYNHRALVEPSDAADLSA